MIGRPRNVVTQRLDELIKRGYVEHRGNRYKMTAKINVPNLQRHVRSNISIIQAAAKQLGAAHSQPLARLGQRSSSVQAR